MTTQQGAEQSIHCTLYTRGTHTRTAELDNDNSNNNNNDYNRDNNVYINQCLIRSFIDVGKTITESVG